MMRRVLARLGSVRQMWLGMLGTGIARYGVLGFGWQTRWVAAVQGSAGHGSLGKSSPVWLRFGLEW